MSEPSIENIKSTVLGQFPHLRDGDSIHAQLTSIEIVELVSLVEETFSIHIHPIEFSPVAFASYESIAALVRKKREKN